MKLAMRSLFTASTIVVVLSSSSLWGQSFMDEPGIPSFTTAFPVENGFVNLANGNLHIEVPIATYPQRGSLKALHARLVYDSRFWIVVHDLINDTQSWQPNGVTPVGVELGGGFRLITDGEDGNVSFSQSTQQCGTVNGQPQYRTTYTDYVYQEPNGTNHHAPGTGVNSFKLFRSSSSCLNGGQVPTGSTFAGDGSGFKFVINNGNVTIEHPDGTVEPAPISGPGAPWLQDTNGNFFTFSKGQDPTITNVIDTLGRTPVVVTKSGSQVFLDYLCEQACNPTAGDRARITINMEAVQWVTQFNQVGVGEFTGGATQAVQSIVFPDGSSYSFQYDSYGMITGITLPTSGNITYGYSNFADQHGNVNRWVTSRLADGQTWNFTPAQLGCVNASSCQMQMTVLTPAYNDGTSTASDNHVFTFAESNRGNWNTQIQYFRGPATGAPVLTKTIDYGFAGQCPAVAASTFTEGLLPIRETLTWPAASGSLAKKAEYCYDNYANLSVTKEWDYQPNAGFAANPDREIDNVYKTDSTYINANMLRLLQTTTRKDGAGTQVAQTTYGYDEYANPGLALQLSGITTGHNTPPGPRGNPTSVSRWLSTSTTPVVSTTAYYDTGEVYQTSDPLKHNTTLTYDSTGAYPGKTCNALNQCSYSAYDFNTGLLTTSTDANGTALGDPAHTTRYSSDTMLRPLCTNLPDGGQTCLSYPSPTNTNRQQKITGTLSDLSSTVLDALGRLSQTQHTTPSGVAKVDTTYDPLGRVFSVSNPYFATSDTTYGVMQTLYDVLSRPVQITKQDGSIATVAYSVRADLKALCTTHTDEAGKQRRTCTNGFGELAEADEPGDSYIGAQAQGNLTVAGSVRSTSTSGAKATGSITITGAKQCTTTGGGGGCIRSPSGGLICSKVDMPLFRYIVTPAATLALQTTTVCNSGNVNVAVNGQSFQQTYGGNDSATTVASNLANQIRSGSASVDYTSVVTNSTTSATIFLQARNIGSAGNNITLSASTSSFDTVDFTSPSFSSSASGATLSGGADPLVTGYDSGSAALTIGSFTGQSVRYSSTQNANAVDLASAVAAAFNASPGAPAVAAINPTGSSTIKITYNAYSAQGNVAASVSSTPDNAATYPGGSFSGSTTLAGGQNPSGPGLDHNYFVTQYAYDALGNLLTVTQKGDPAATSSSQWRVRNFTYDSMSRLLTADNPEAGHITYTYDNDGELIQKTSPAPNQTGTATQQISYCYEPLHRMTDKSYTAQAPVIGQPCTLTGVVVHQAYDTGANGIGHLTSLTDQAGSGLYSYDNLGRISSETRVLSAVSKSMSYEYNLDGSLFKLHYPSTRVVTYTPWNNGAAAVNVPMQATDSNGTQYVTNATFYANLAEYQRFMPGIYFRTDLNPRLQIAGFYSDNGLTASFFMNKSYSYGALHRNNGNVSSITNNKDSSRTQTFTYDLLNRIASAYSAANTGTLSWGENYSIDPWSNLQISPMAGKTSGGNFQCAANVQNHAACLGYDAAGNVTTYTTAGQYVYDAENRLQSTAGTSYTYDSEGNRVLKQGGTAREYWYSGDNVLAESDGSGNLTSEYVYFDGQRIARIDLPSNSVHFYLSDHLNSTSMVISSSGAIEEESDYTPFGTEKPITTGGNRYKFTGKEHDTESQLDYFGARYYSSALGRFTSADAGPIHGSNPQALNLYTYAINNPLENVDPDGDRSVSAVYKIGTADVTIWAKDQQGSLDLSGLLNSMYPVKVFPYSKSTGIGQDAFFSGERRAVNLPANIPDSLGGCGFGCYNGYVGSITGYDVQLSFSYGADGNGPIDGVNITLTENPDLHYVGDLRKLEPDTPIPGGLGFPPEVHFDINQSQFSAFSDAQLAAIGKAVAGRVDDLSVAIAAALTREQQRRAQAEKRKKDCGADGGKAHDQCKK